MLNSKQILILAAFLGFTMSAPTDHWAVLVAGSNTYSNYRHQADVFHAYQILKRNGIPQDQIILFAYDDVANNIRNPFPGKVFNKPNGEDVYAGVKIDYSGKDVTPENFISVLKGDSAALKGVGTGKVLKSDSNSKVFINFVDHGATGLVAFPNDVLYADDLVDTLVYMNTNKLYGQLVFYLEACESGSMFKGLLPSNINIYATTAANAIESSYAAYCSPSEVVSGTHIGSCLGDLYSVSWMEDTDAMNPSVESLATQFSTVLTETSMSHVQEYGQTSFKSEVIGDFQGDLDIPMSKIFANLVKKALRQQEPKDLALRQTFTVDSRNAKLASLYGNVLHNPSHTAHLDLQEELTHRMKVDHIWERIVEKLDFSQEFHLPRNFQCLKALVKTYQDSCGAFSDYSLKYVKFLVNECETLSVPSAVDGIATKIQRVCAAH